MSLKFVAAALVAKTAVVGSIQTVVTRVGDTTEWTWDNDGWDMEGWVSVGGNEHYRFIPRPQLSGNPPNHLGIYTGHKPNDFGRAEHEPLKAVSPRFCNARSIEFALLSGMSDPESRLFSVHDIDEYKDYGDDSLELTQDLAGYSVIAEIEMPEVLPPSRSWLLNIGQAGQYADHWLVDSDGLTQFGPWSASGQVKKDISSYLGQTITIITTYDFWTYNVYINGELFGSAEHENIYLLSNSVFIGKELYTMKGLDQFADAESDFTGTFHFVEMYNRVFSDDEILTGPSNVDDEGYLGLVLLNDDGAVVRHAERTEPGYLTQPEVFVWKFPAEEAYECYTLELRDTKSGDWGHIGLEYAIVHHRDRGREKTLTPQPTAAPSSVEPTASPTIVPTWSPTIVPTWSPTIVPTSSPTAAPTWAPSRSPTVQPSHALAEPEFEPLDFLEYGILCSINGDSKGACKAIGCKYRKKQRDCVALSVKKTKCRRVKDKDVCLRLGCKFGEDLTKSWNRQGCSGKPSNLFGS